MKTFKGALALLILTGLLLAPVMGIFSQAAEARAEYVTWADRVTRPTAPSGYCTPGTCVESIVLWPGVRGVGNLGIGNGNISLMEPDFINDAMRSFNESLTKNESAQDNVTGGVIAAPRNNSEGNGTLVSREMAARNNTNGNNTNGNNTNGNNTAAAGNNTTNEGVPGPEESVPVTESLLPNDIMAAGVITRAEPYSITINQPFPHILNENPVEAGVIYGKMFGLPLPDGRMIDIGIKSLGSEY